jgi:hypothetical protein
VSIHEADGTFHPKRLTYTTLASVPDDHWRLEGIYLDADSGKGEASQPGILDPGEEAKLLLRLSPAAAATDENSLMVGLSNGVTSR